MTAAGRGGQLLLVVFVGTVTTLSILPPFLLGTLVVQVRSDFDLGPSTLGLIVAAYFASTSLNSPWLGRWVQRRGLRRGLVWTVCFNVVGLVSVAQASEQWHLFVAMLVAGLGNAASNPTTNAMVVHGVRLRLGLALGSRLAAVPAALLVSGVAVPTIALTVGWRYTFVIAAVASVILLGVGLTIAPSRASVGAAIRGTANSSRRLGLTLAAASAIGVAGTNSVGIFLVDSGVSHSGIAAATAALLTAAAGATSVIVRVLLGSIADRHAKRALTIAAAILVVAAVGTALLGVSVAWVYPVGAFLAYGIGAGWPGLLHFVVVDGARDAAATNTGRLISGFALGSALGPLTFGFVAEGSGFAAMWSLAAAMSTISALMVLLVWARPGLLFAGPGSEA